MSTGRAKAALQRNVQARRELLLPVECTGDTWNLLVYMSSGQFAISTSYAGASSEGLAVPSGKQETRDEYHISGERLTFSAWPGQIRKVLPRFTVLSMVFSWVISE